MSSPVLLIGIGNEYRSDDAVGLVVIRALRAKGLPDTVCIESIGLSPEVEHAAQEAVEQIMKEVRRSL